MGVCPHNVVVRTVGVNLMESMSHQNVADNLTFCGTKLEGQMIAL